MQEQGPSSQRHQRQAGWVRRKRWSLTGVLRSTAGQFQGVLQQRMLGTTHCSPLLLRVGQGHMQHVDRIACGCLYYDALAGATDRAKWQMHAGSLWAGWVSHKLRRCAEVCSLPGEDGLEPMDEQIATGFAR